MLFECKVYDKIIYAYKIKKGKKCKKPKNL